MHLRGCTSRQQYARAVVSYLDPQSWHVLTDTGC